jgi:SAM-dependent methyltransferase
MTADSQTLGVYAEKAEDYANRFATGRPDPRLRDFIESLPTGGRVLDLGCGPGRAAAAMKEAGLQVDAWDASPEMAALAQERFGVAVRVAGFDELDASETYDGVYANFSLLHAPKAEMPGHLARIARALKPGGFLHLGLKAGTGEKRDSLGRFYAYYEDDEITGLLSDVGISVLTRATGAEAGLGGTVDPWIILKARKND